MTDDTRRLRLGGMALANGLLVSGPTSWAAAVVDDHGEVIVGSGPRPKIAGGILERIPLTRGVIRMAESMMTVPAFSERSVEFFTTRPNSLGEHSEKRAMLRRWSTVVFVLAM